MAQHTAQMSVEEFEPLGITLDTEELKQYAD